MFVTKCESESVPEINMENNKEVTPSNVEKFCENRDGMWRFPSCLIQDSPCVKEEVKDEITVEEGGVNCEIGEESKALDQHQFASNYCPIKVELADDFNSQEWKHVYIEETGDTSIGSYLQQERDPLSADSDVPVDHQNLYMKQDNTSGSFVDTRKYEEMSAYTRKGVKAVKTFVCKFCNKAFMYPSDLYVHTHMIHTKCKSLDCEVKLKKVRKQGNRYECIFCNKQVYGLFKNFRCSRAHVGPYSTQKITCESCGESYSRCYFSKVSCGREPDMPNVNPNLRDFYFF